MKNLLTWDVCRPIRTSDVTAGDIIATHTFFRRFIVAYHDDFIHYYSACCKTSSRTYCIRNCVTRRFRMVICFYTVKTPKTGGFVAQSV